MITTECNTEYALNLLRGYQSWIVFVVHLLEFEIWIIELLRVGLRSPSFQVLILLCILCSVSL